jgi:hypothetical protein
MKKQPLTLLLLKALVALLPKPWVRSEGIAYSQLCILLGKTLWRQSALLPSTFGKLLWPTHQGLVSFSAFMHLITYSLNIRSVRDLLPTLIDQIVNLLASPDSDQREVRVYS